MFAILDQAAKDLRAGNDISGYIGKIDQLSSTVLQEAGRIGARQAVLAALVLWISVEDETPFENAGGDLNTLFHNQLFFLISNDHKTFRLLYFFFGPDQISNLSNSGFPPDT